TRAGTARETRPTPQIPTDVLYPHAERHQVEDRDRDPDVTRPSVHGRAGERLAHVLDRGAQRKEARAKHERRETQQVRGAPQCPRRVARSRAEPPGQPPRPQGDRKSTRLNSSHVSISYAVFCLKKKNTQC